MVVEHLMKRLQIWHLLKEKIVAIHALQSQEHTVFLGHCHLFFPWHLVNLSDGNDPREYTWLENGQIYF